MPGLVDAQGNALPTSEMERTEGGLVVPKGTAEKKPRTIIQEDWKKWRRTIVQMAAQGVAVRLFCEACQSLLQPMENEKALQCECSKFKLPGWTAVQVETEMPAASPQTIRRG